MKNNIKKWICIDQINLIDKEPSSECSGFILNNAVESNVLMEQLSSLYQSDCFDNVHVAIPFVAFKAEGMAPENSMISLPVTANNLVVGQDLLFSGHNVHFQAYSLSHYEKAMKLYLRAIEDRDIHFRPLQQVKSIISFDAAAIDEAVNERLQRHAGDFSELESKATIALVKLTAQKYARYFSGESWTWLANHAAQPQSILVDVSRVTKPQYYIDELAENVQHFAFSAKQLETIRFGGDAKISISNNRAAHILSDLGELGIHLDEIGDLLVDNRS